MSKPHNDRCIPGKAVSVTSSSSVAAVDRAASRMRYAKTAMSCAGCTAGVLPCIARPADGAANETASN